MLTAITCSYKPSKKNHDVSFINEIKKNGHVLWIRYFIVHAVIGKYSTMRWCADVDYFPRTLHVLLRVKHLTSFWSSCCHFCLVWIVLKRHGYSVNLSIKLQGGRQGGGLVRAVPVTAFPDTVWPRERERMKEPPLLRSGVAMAWWW